MIPAEEGFEPKETNEEAVTIKQFFFVDYENVNKGGLNGICNLSENDCVKIYYSDNAQTLSWGLHRRINASSAKFIYAKIDTYGIENAIDIHIILDVKQAYLSHKDTAFYIISNDRDFDKAIEDYCKKGINVKRISQVCDSYHTNASQTANKPAAKPKAAKTVVVKAVKPVVSKAAAGKEPDKREQAIRSVFGMYFNESPYKEHKEQIIRLLLNARDRQSLNNELTKVIPSSSIPKLRTQLKDVFSALPSCPSADKKKEDSPAESDGDKPWNRTNSLHKSDCDGSIYITLSNCIYIDKTNLKPKLQK